MDTKISLSVLFHEFMSTYFGWDTSFARTLRGLITKPHIVISEYLNGVRKRYMPPIVFVSFGVALSSIAMNIYSDEYLKFANSFSNAQYELIQDGYENGTLDEKAYNSQLEGIEQSKKIQQYTLKYFNVISFALLPLYALISLLVFGRRFNYGEHLVINSYLQGMSFFIGILFIVAGIYIWQPLMYIQVFIVMPYYLWTFAKLMSFGIGKAILKFLLFVAVLAGLVLVFAIISIVVGILFAVLS